MSNQAVVDDGDVLHVDRRDFVVGEQLRADGRDLVALTDEPVGGEVVLVREVPVDLAEAVPAIAVFGIAGVEVVHGPGGVPRRDVGAPQGVEGVLHDAG